MIATVRAIVAIMPAVALLAGCRQSTSSERSCTAVFDHVLTLMQPVDDYAKSVALAFRLRCEQDSWSAQAKACLLSTTSIDSPKNCRSKLTDEQSQRLDAALDAAEHSRFPASCTQYEKLLEKALACEVLPTRMRAALKSNYEAKKAEYADAPDLREFATICENAFAGLKQATIECPGADKW
jgi:hypothetical protein